MESKNESLASTDLGSEELSWRGKGAERASKGAAAFGNLGQKEKSKDSGRGTKNAGQLSRRTSDPCESDMPVSSPRAASHGRASLLKEDTAPNLSSQPQPHHLNTVTHAQGKFSPPPSPRNSSASQFRTSKIPIAAPKPPTTFSFSRSLRNGGGGSALQVERATWNGWIRSIREKKLRAREICDVVAGARLTFPSSVISRRECGEMVVLLISQIEGGGEEESHSLCHDIREDWQGVADLITFFSQKKHLDFGPSELGIVMAFLLSMTNQSLQNITPIEQNQASLFALLQAISFVVFNFASRCGMYQEKLLETLLDGVLVRTDGNNEQSLACVSTAYSCIGNLLQKKAIEKTYESKIVSFTVSSLKKYQALILTSSPAMPELRLPQGKVLYSLLRVMHGTNLAFGTGAFSEHLSALVESLMSLVCHGLTSAIAEKKGRSGTDLPPPQPSPRNATTDCESKTLALFSESELSDSDMERKSSSSRYLKQMEKVKVTALEVLQSLCKVEYKGMSNLWDRMLPVRNGCDPETKQPTLLTVLLFDPQPKVRASCYGTLSSLLESSPVRIWLSQRRPKSAQGASFASLSMKIARILEQVHLALRLALNMEKNPTTFAQVFVCVGVLFRVMPYEIESNKQMLLQLIKEPIPPSKESGGDIIFRTLFDKQSPKVTESVVQCVASLLAGPKAPLQSVKDFVESSLVFKLLGVPSTVSQETKEFPLGLRNTLFLSGKICVWYPEQIIDLWDTRLHSALLKGFASHEVSSREAAVLLVDQIVKADQEKNVTMNLGGWTDIVAVHLPRALRDVEPDVRAAAASCLAEVRLEVWSNIPTQYRQECLQNIIDTAVTGTSSPQVRLASLSALGSMALLFSFKSDPDFLDRAVPTMLVALDDESILIRSRAAILIANTVSSHEDAAEAKILPGSPSGRAKLLAEKQGSVRYQLLDGVLMHCGDHDKVAAPVLRAVGFLVGNLSPLEGRTKLVLQAKDALTACLASSSSSKVVLNACNALAYVIQNSDILDLWNEKEMRGSLLWHARLSENFKVRTAAIQVLVASVSQKSHDLCILEEWVSSFASEYVDFWQKKHSLNPTQEKHAEKLAQSVAQLVSSSASTLSFEGKSSLIKQHRTLLRAFQSSLDVHHPAILVELDDLLTLL